MKYQIVNLVASGELKATLDLYNLAVSIPNIEYEPEQFPGAILKLKEPKVSMLLFKNGKVICSGASSEEQIGQGIRKASKLIHEIQKDVKVQRKVTYTVVNLVATANLNVPLDLFSILVASRRYAKLICLDPDCDGLHQAFCGVAWIDYYAVPDPNSCLMGLSFQKTSPELTVTIQKLTGIPA